MSIVHIPQNTYTIESVKYPGVVFDLQGSTPDGPIICHSRSQGALNQIACSHSNDVVLKLTQVFDLTFQWSLQYIDEASNTFILQAVSPSGNIFTAKTIEGAETVGSPSHRILLQARMYDDMKSQYQIIPASQPDGKDLALQAPGSEGGKITFEISNPSAQDQQWIFNNMNPVII